VIILLEFRRILRSATVLIVGFVEPFIQIARLTATAPTLSTWLYERPFEL